MTIWGELIKNASFQAALGGALVGGAFTLLGTFLAHRWAVESIRRQKVEAARAERVSTLISAIKKLHTVQKQLRKVELSTSKDARENMMEKIPTVSAGTFEIILKVQPVFWSGFSDGEIELAFKTNDQNLTEKLLDFSERVTVVSKALDTYLQYFFEKDEYLYKHAIVSDQNMSSEGIKVSEPVAQYLKYVEHMQAHYHGVVVCEVPKLAKRADELIARLNSSFENIKEEKSSRSNFSEQKG